MRKSFILLLLMVSVCLNMAAQSSQKGVTMEYHGKKKKTVLSNVMIVASGASCRSDNNGSFSLQFNTLKPGDKVDVNRIAKSGYVVFNKDALDQWIVSSSSHSFTIVMCKADEFDELVNTYYGVSLTYYENRLKAAKEEIVRLKSEGKLKEVEYNDRLAEIDQQYQDALVELEEKAQIMARIDESEISDEDSRILALAKEGKIDEAIELIKRRNIDEKLDKSIKKKQLAEEQERQARAAARDAQHEIEVMIASLRNDIKVLMLAGGEENYRLCADKWRSIIAANDTNYAHICDYLDFLCDQKYFDEGIALCERCEAKRCFSNAEMANIYNKKGNLYFESWKYDNAITAYEKSLELYSKESNREAYTRMICVVRANIAATYIQMQDYTKAEQTLIPATEALRELVKKNDNIDNLKSLSMNLNTMARIKRKNKQFDEAYRYIDEAERIAQQNVETYPEDVDCLSRLAYILVSSGATRFENAKYKEALPLYLRSQGIFERLATKNPREYAYKITECQANLALTYWHLDQDSLGLEYARKNLAGVTALADENPKMYMPRKAEALGTLSSILSSFDINEAAEKCGMAIEMLEEYGKMYPGVYTDLMSELCHNRGALLNSLKRYDEAWECYAKAIEIRSEKAVAEPNAYFADLASSLQQAVFVLSELHRPDVADTLCTKAYELFKIEAERNPQLYGAKINKLTIILAMVRGMHATIFFDKANLPETERLYRESLELYQGSNSAKINLAAVLALQGKTKEAIAIATPLKDAMFNKKTSCADFVASLCNELREKGQYSEKQLKNLEKLVDVFK